MKKKKAIRLAVDAIRRRQKVFVCGYKAYSLDYESHWTARDFKKYVELEDAIRALESIYEEL